MINNSFDFVKHDVSTRPGFLAWFKHFWGRFSSTLTNSKGTPPKGLEAAEKACNRAIKDKDFYDDIKTPEQFCKTCDLALEAQQRYLLDCKRHNRFAKSMGMVSTWFNQSKWDEEIGQHSELRQTGEQSYKPAKKPILGNTKDPEAAKKILDELRNSIKH